MDVIIYQFPKLVLVKVIQAGKLALANASKNLAGWVENRPGRFCLGYRRDYPVRASAKNF